MKKALSIILSLCIAAAILFVAVSCGKITCEYDENGNKIKESYYDAESKLKDYFICEYDGNGNEIKYLRYDAEGKFAGYFVYEYDADGNKIKASYYDASCKLIYSE